MFYKEALFEMYRPKTEEINVEGFSGLLVKQLSEREIAQIRKDSGLSSDKKDGDQSNDLFGTKMIVTSIVDNDGNRVFCDSDIDRMRDCANTLMHNLTQRVLKMNGFINDEKNA